MGEEETDGDCIELGGKMHARRVEGIGFRKKVGNGRGLHESAA